MEWPDPALKAASKGRILRRGLRVTLLFAMILGPALLIARPAVFADTPLYYGQGEALARALATAFTGVQSAPDAVTLADPFAVVKGSLGARTGALLVAGARSPTYGLMLYLCHVVGGLRALVVLQAALAALAAEIFLASFARTNRAAFAAGAVLLAAGAALPFFAAFAMPDVFAGLDLLMVAVLLVGRPSKAEGALALALLVLGAATHPTHLFILILLIPTAPLLLRLGFKTPLKDLAPPIVLMAAAAIAAMSLESFEHALIAKAAGEREGTPPFLMARLLEDGPGRAYLAKACPGGAAPLLCQFKLKPLNDSEAFLWSGRKADGVVMTMDPAARMRLKAEEPAFALAVLRAFPLEVAVRAATNAGRQLLLFATIEPLHSPSEFAVYPFWRKTALFVRDRDGCSAQGSCANGLAAPLLNLEETLATLLGLGAAAAACLRRPQVGDAPGAHMDTRRLKAAFAVLVLGVVLNACVCGALSGAFPRYEARLLWVLPFCGLVLFMASRSQKSAAPAVGDLMAGSARPRAPRGAPDTGRPVSAA